MTNTLKKAEEVGINTVVFSEAVSAYLAMNKQIKELEENLKPLKAQIIAEMDKMDSNAKGQKIIEIPELAKCTLAEACRDNFSIKKAQEALTEDFFSEHIEPFVNTTFFNKLLVKSNK